MRIELWSTLICLSLFTDKDQKPLLLNLTELTSYQLRTQPLFTCSKSTMETPEQGVESA